MTRRGTAGTRRRGRARPTRGGASGRVRILRPMATETSLPADRPPLAERALSRRVREVPPSGIRRFFDILATMDDVISLGRRRAGLRHPGRHRRGRRREPDARAGPTTRATTGRSSSGGPWPPTSTAATASATTRPREILITVGASEAVDLALRATCDPGDEVILHEPSYVVVRARRSRSPAARRSTSRPARRRLRARPGARSRRPSRPGRRRSSWATRATRPGPSSRTTSRTSWRRSPPGTTCSSTATRSTTGSCTARTATGRSARCPGCASGRS